MAETDVSEQEEGWHWIAASMLRHYYAHGRALCGKQALLVVLHGNREDDGSRYNCYLCRRSLEKRRRASKRAQRGQSDEP